MSFTTHPSPRRIARAALSLGTAAALVATLGAPASFAAPTKANDAERAKAHTTISSLSSAQQKAGFNRFVITYTDSALNAGGINWASPAGTQVATWSDALYSGISSDVKSIDNLLKVKTSYVRTTAQKATVVTLSSKLSAEQAEKYMAALSSNPSVASVEPDLLRRSNARARGAANSKVAPANCGGSIVVGATDQEGKRSDFSNYGKIVDVSAPGSSIMSTVDLGTTVSTGAGYTEYDGTSMAAPRLLA
ncbi:S8 family serine peptidase [Rothia sp. P3C3.S176]|uniref:S8 family serine peptidase n=1 Tax=Rothia sp. P3C3.S176 TaxID=2962204 RepID=UPI0020C869E5|nr:S8 family serine peptidase [Rothia sp. P3C3.S176]MCP8995393.1 S8 family serine peptidase [Rothia sp. P3C3.S176]